MTLHAKRQGFDACQNQKGVEGRDGRPEIAQRQHAAGNGEGKIAERLGERDAVIAGAGGGQCRIAPGFQPVERAAIDDGAAKRVAMAAEKLRQRMHDDIGAILDRPHQIGRGERVIDDQRHAGFLGDRGDGGDVSNNAAGIGDRLDEDRLDLRRQRGAERLRVGRIGKAHRPAAFLEGVRELVDRSAIELPRRDELIPWLEQRVEDQHLRGVTGRHRKRRRPAFKRRDPLLEHGLGRIGDARIDVAERLEVEQRRRVIDIVEHEGTWSDRSG